MKNEQIVRKTSHRGPNQPGRRSDDGFALPPLWCPIPSATHSAWQELDAGALAWADRFGLVTDPVQRRRLAQAMAGDLAGRIMPRSDAGSARSTPTSKNQRTAPP